MRRLWILCVLLVLFAVPALPQRGGQTASVQNLLPLCSATSGSCPSNNYFCTNSDEQIYRCTVASGWQQQIDYFIGTTCNATCSQGQTCFDTDATAGRNWYCCTSANTWTECGGGGGGVSNLSGLSDVSAPTPLSGQFLIYDGVDSWDNKTASTDIAVDNSGSFTINADAVALTTDTTGNYVSSATASQGLLLTGTEGASLGFVDCAADEVLKRNSGDTAWECAADAGAVGGQAIILDLGDGGPVEESQDLGEIATTGDTNSIFSEPTADKLLITLSNNWPTADLADAATALAANPAACSANQYVSDLDADGTLTCAQPSIFPDSDFQSANPFIDFDDTDAGDSNNVRIESNCTNATLSNETCDVWFNQDINEPAGSSASKITLLLDADGGMIYTGRTDVIQTTVKGFTTQTNDILVVEKSDGTDLFTVDETTAGGYITIGDPGDNNRGFETQDNTTSCPDPAASHTTYCTKTTTDAPGGVQAYIDKSGTEYALVAGTGATTYGPAVWATTVTCDAACDQMGMSCQDAWILAATPTDSDCTTTTNPRVCFCK